MNFQFTNPWWLALVPVVAIIIALGFFPQRALDVINPTVGQTMTVIGSTDPVPAIAESGK